MRVVDKGSGPPLVIIPGIQGRWEYVRDAVDELATRFRVLTFSLPDERGFGARAQPIDGFIDEIERMLDARAIPSAAICGVSFGGRIALRFAAERPSRTAALVLVSTPGPRWQLRESHRAFARSPWLSAPAFLVGATSRMRRELRFALPSVRDRIRFLMKMGTLALTAPSSPARMAARASMIDNAANDADCARIACPTLVLNGEPALDHVVPVDGSSEYVRLIAGASIATLHGTGHQGPILRPREFAGIVGDFVASSSRSKDRDATPEAHDAA